MEKEDRSGEEDSQRERDEREGKGTREKECIYPKE